MGVVDYRAEKLRKNVAIHSSGTGFDIRKAVVPDATPDIVFLWSVVPIYCMLAAQVADMPRKIHTFPRIHA
jgi:hypothetical protein